MKDVASYARVVVAFSGGKDSLACVLHLLELGVPREKIELWHHDVDGREGSELMDWPCTRDYCRKVAAALNLTLYCSWRVGGFEREMLRDNTPTAPTCFETPDGVQQVGGCSNKKNTRLKFPQVSCDLTVRWCSAYLKIDVARRALANQRRFESSRTLFVTGERSEESTARAGYETFEPHLSDTRAGRMKRHIDHWRPVHGWSEREVWAIIERHRINPHPAYRLGWGRVSCMLCIFGNADQFASARKLSPTHFNRLPSYEERFGKTIKRKLNIVQLADQGTPYEMDPVDIRAALSRDFCEPIILQPGAWKLPRGAFGDSCGPT